MSKFLNSTRLVYERLKQYPFAVFIFLSSILFYGNITSEMYWDDALLFFGPWIQDENFAIWKLWYDESGYFKAWPGLYSLFAFLYTYIKNSIWIYKALAVLAHITNTILIYKILEKLKTPYSFVLALIFLSHPNQVETSLWIFQMTNSIAILFGLLAFMSFLNFEKSTQKRKVFATLLFFAYTISLSFKIVLAGLPFCLILYYIYKRRPLNNYLILIPLFISTAYFTLASFRGIYVFSSEKYVASAYQVKITPIIVPEFVKKLDSEKSKAMLTKIPDVSGLLVPFKNLGFYIYQSLIPLDFMIMYSHDFFEIKHFMALFLFLLILALNFRNPIFRERQLIVFVLMLAIYIPISGIVYIPHFKYAPVADRYLYFPLLFVFITLAYFFRSIEKKIPKIYLNIFTVLFVVFLSFKFVNYAKLFTGGSEIYFVNYKKNPNNTYPIIMKGYHDFFKGDLKGLEHALNIVTEAESDLYFKDFYALVFIAYPGQDLRWLKIFEWFKNKNQIDKAQHFIKMGLKAHPFSEKLKEINAKYY